MTKNLFSKYHFIPILILLFFAKESVAQDTTVRGKIIDAETGDGVPFVNVVFKGTSIGTTTDFDGYYTLKTNNPGDSITASYIGYIRKTKVVQKGKNQVVNFQLADDVIGLEEVVFVAPENPAFAIMRNVINNKDRNDKRSLESFDCESYTKIEVDVDQISSEFRNRKIMKKITQVMDSLDQIAGEDGEPILPIFISESLSRYYVNSNPYLRKEDIIKTKITGVGIENGSLTSQFIGSTFQEYNFYNNWLVILEKDFISPIANGWKGFYEYDLVDSLMVDGHYCYRIDYFPKRKEDLAFIGSMWITKDGYALRQIDAKILKSANLNFVEKVKIQQQLEPSELGPWLPGKTRVLIDVQEVTNKSAGMLVKFYTSNRDWNLNDVKKTSFYENPIEVAEDYTQFEDDYWELHRHDSLTATELHVYGMIDTLRNIPVVKTLTQTIELLADGYVNLGKVEIGTYFSAYANNSIEGNRFRLGLKTNYEFSKKWVLRGSLAYGTLDKRWKYSASIRHIVSRKPWTEFSIGHFYDVDQVGLTLRDLSNNPIFFAATRFGNLRRPYINTESFFTFRTLISKGLTQRISFRRNEFNPLFNFQYKTQPENVDSPLASNYTTSEVAITTRFSLDEVVVIDDNDRISVSSPRWPVFTGNYTFGVKGFLGSDLKYHRASINISQILKMGSFGKSSYSLTAGRVFSNVPYPLLKVHLGNESLFYSTAAYNLMDWFEFISDTYGSFRYQHRFEGLILNRIPLMRKLKWRLVATGSVLYGGISQNNKDIIPKVIGEDGISRLPFKHFDKDKPYVELGYGVENIFKIFRVDAFHRMTYLDSSDTRRFGIKISMQLIL